LIGGRGVDLVTLGVLVGCVNSVVELASFSAVKRESTGSVISGVGLGRAPEAFDSVLTVTSAWLDCEFNREFSSRFGV
jgi:hypothetical protein